jgi:hypothetical protein
MSGEKGKAGCQNLLDGYVRLQYARPMLFKTPQILAVNVVVVADGRAVGSCRV